MKRVLNRFNLSILTKYNKLLFTFLAIVQACSMFATVAEYNIKSLGMKVATISISTNSDKIEVKANSIGSSPIFPRLNNSYTIDLDNQHRPVNYTRKINQKTVQDEVIVKYNRVDNTASMHKKSTGTMNNYIINPNSRDVFSFMALLISGNAASNKYPIDANGTPWLATITSRSKDEVKTKFKKFSTTRFDIEFVSLSKTGTSYVDMVTHNFVNEDTKLSIWVADEDLAVKAVVKKRGISMNWELTGYQP